MQLHNEIQVIVKLKYSNYQALQFWWAKAWIALYVNGSRYQLAALVFIKETLKLINYFAAESEYSCINFQFTYKFNILHCCFNWWQELHKHSYFFFLMNHLEKRLTTTSCLSFVSTSAVHNLLYHKLTTA